MERLGIDASEGASRARGDAETVGEGGTTGASVQGPTTTGVSTHWTDEDDREMERLSAEGIERAGGPLLHYARWAAADAAWAAKVRELCGPWQRRTCALSSAWCTAPKRTVTTNARSEE